MTIEDIRTIVAGEFGTQAERFRFIELDLGTALSPKRPQLGRGVYVFWTRNGVVRVGKSSSRNVCQRAIEHIRDNTGGLMGALRGDLSAFFSSSQSRAAITGFWPWRPIWIRRSTRSFQPRGDPDSGVCVAAPNHTLQRTGCAGR